MKQTPRELDPLQEKWFDFVLNEYNSLRTEVSDSLKNQQSIINYGLAAIGVLIGLSANLWGKERIIEVLFVFFIPFVCNLIMYIWNGEVRRMSRAGQYIKLIEDKVHAELSKSPAVKNRSLNWETYLREPKTETKRSSAPITSSVPKKQKSFWSKTRDLIRFLFPTKRTQKDNKIKSNYISIIIMFAVLSTLSILLAFGHSYSQFRAPFGDFEWIFIQNWFYNSLPYFMGYSSLLIINLLFFIYHYRYFQEVKK